MTLDCIHCSESLHPCSFYISFIRWLWLICYLIPIFSPIWSLLWGKKTYSKEYAFSTTLEAVEGDGDKGGMVSSWLQLPGKCIFKIKWHYQNDLGDFFWLCDRTSQPQFQMYEILKGLLLSGNALKWKFFIDWEDCTIRSWVSYEHSGTQSEHVKPKRKQRPALSERFCKC